MTLGTVQQLYRYPVKSMGGEAIRTAVLGKLGIEGDRAWALRDEETGHMTGGKRIPALMRFSARTSGDAAEITLPDGTTVSTAAADASEVVSNALGRKVSLQALRPPEDLDFYRQRATPPDDVEGYLRELFARAPDEPLPDMRKFPKEIFRFSSPPGSFVDVAPLMVMSQAGLDHLQARAPRSRFDVRRFRPSFLVDDARGDGAIPEYDWTGRRVRVGGAVLEITTDCPRCVMATVGFADLPKDPKVMRTIVAEAGGSLGVYANVLEPGMVSVGDMLEWAD